VVIFITSVEGGGGGALLAEFLFLDEHVLHERDGEGRYDHVEVL